MKTRFTKLAAVLIAAAFLIGVGPAAQAEAAEAAAPTAVRAQGSVSGLIDNVTEVITKTTALINSISASETARSILSAVGAPIVNKLGLAEADPVEVGGFTIAGAIALANLCFNLIADYEW